MSNLDKVPAAIIYAFMDWDFFEALYFSMVTFTTVGFGDLTITDSNYKFVIILFSYFGLVFDQSTGRQFYSKFSLAWIGVIAGVVTEKIQETNKVRATSDEKAEAKSISSEL